MSIIVKGMGMPLGCVSCPFYCKIQTAGGTELYCKAARKEIGVERGICPLVPLQEGHGRLGDLDKINASLEAMIEIEHNQNAAPFSWSYAYSEMQSILDDAPTIVPAEGGTSE